MILQVYLMEVERFRVEFRQSKHFRRFLLVNTNHIFEEYTRSGHAAAGASAHTQGIVLSDFFEMLEALSACAVDYEIDDCELVLRNLLA